MKASFLPSLTYDLPQSPCVSIAEWECVAQMCTDLRPGIAPLSSTAPRISFISCRLNPTQSTAQSATPPRPVPSSRYTARAYMSSSTPSAGLFELYPAR